MRYWYSCEILMLVVCTLLGACSGASPVEQTLVAENQMLSTQIVDIRSTATVEADRLLITLEHAQTDVRHVDDQNLNLVATLVERGTPIEAISGITPIAVTAAAPSQQGDTVPLASSEEVNAQGDAPTATAAAPAATVTVAGPPRLSSIVTAEGIDENDCAINPSTTFSTNTAEIYVVAVAANLQPGTTFIVSRWRQEGAEVVTFDFNPEFTEGCLWFFIDQSDIVFTPGNWSVELEINGGLVGAPVSFTIVDAAAEG